MYPTYVKKVNEYFFLKQKFWFQNTFAKIASLERPTVIQEVNAIALGKKYIFQDSGVRKNLLFTFF